VMYEAAVTARIGLVCADRPRETEFPEENQCFARIFPGL
jgi:hypothetical protein